jgi:serine/threonine protein kinase
MNGSLFISYSRVDSLSMQAFKLHLNGILMNHCRVWTDEDIPPGTTWEEALLGNLQQAGAGLVLVSPDYLVSPWCRRELKFLADARKSNQLAGVYWVLLKPCGWKWTELAELQAVQEPPDQALLSLPELEREWQILRCCETIATGLKPLLTSGDKVLTAIRAILLRSEHRSNIRVLKALSEGDFSIVARGIEANGNDVVIKVLTNTPLHRLKDLFFRVSRACKNINVPSVVRTIDVFTDGEGYDQRIVIVSELARGEPLSKVMDEDAELPASKRHLTLDTIGLLLRLVAEALDALHSMDHIEWPGGDDSPYKHVMGPLSSSHIFYDRATQRPQISLVGVTNFLWRFFDEDTFRRIVGPESGAYVLPENRPASALATGSVTQGDQYFLGLLALELLEGRSPSITAFKDQRIEALDVVKNARWARRHQQLSGIVSRLLAKNPEHRFHDMKEVIANLYALEDSSRALAKYSFHEYVAPDEGDSPGSEFAKSFYENLFTRSSAVKEVFLKARQRRTAAIGQAQQSLTMTDETQHRKLIDGLKAVLNFRPGCGPSSIDSVAAHHIRFDLNADHFNEFEESFIATLEQRVARSTEDREEMLEITFAWRKLFAPVRAAMLDKSGRRCPDVAAGASQS